MPAPDRGGFPRPGVLLCYRDGKPVASAAKVSGTADSWVVVPVDSEGYELYGSDLAARAAMLAIADGVR